MANGAAKPAAIERANQPIFVTLSTGAQVPLSKKALDWDAYDSEILLATGAQSLRLFASRIFQNGILAGTQKSRVDTNMEADGAFVTPKTHYALGLMVELLPATNDNERIDESDFLNLKANSWIEFWQGQRKVWTLNVEQLSGPGFNGLVNNVSTLRNIQFGTTDPGNYFRYGKAYANGPNQSFTYIFRTTSDLSMSAPVRVKLLTPGYLDTVVA